jgi:nucleoside-diphosphate-sugar epimerase
MLTIAVIGSRSFLAGHFISAAAGAGWRVIAIDRPDADVRDVASLERALGGVTADVVVNFAAISHVVGGNTRDFYEVNAFGQGNVLQALAKTGFSGRHVFISSANVYGASDQPMKETDAPRPANHYGASKVLAEGFCNFLGGGFTTHIVRPFNCIGLGQPENFLAPKIIAAFRNGETELVLGNLGVERDFVDARDFAQMLMLLAEKGSPHPIINFGNGEVVRIGGLIAAAERVSGRKMTVRSAAEFQRAGDILRQQGDIARLRELGYSRRYPIEETIRWMLSGEA